MIPSPAFVRLAAAIIEQICAAKGLQLDGPTIDAAIQSQVAKVAAQMGVPDRTALGYVRPETLAVEVAANLITGHELPQQIGHNPADPPSRFSRDALVYTTAPTATACARRADRRGRARRTHCQPDSLPGAGSPRHNDYLGAATRWNLDGVS